MSFLDRLRGTTVAADPADELREQLRAEQESNLMLVESLAELEVALDDAGWRQLALTGADQFSPEGRRRIRDLSRLMTIANPLIRRAVNLRTHYVWGQGVQVAARDDTLNETVQAFVDDPGNQRALFGEQAREDREQDLHDDGELFLALFTHPRTGRVQIRLIDPGEVGEPIRNPDDRDDVWFWPRQWTQAVGDPVTGGSRHEQQAAFYPDVRHRPRTRSRTIAGREVRWDSPVMHVAVNRHRGRGIPDVYAALSWARAYKEFLEDWAGYVKALSRFAWQAKTKSSKVNAAAKRLQETRGTAPAEGAEATQRRTSAAGATFVGDGASSLDPIKQSGAHVDSESGKPLAMMVGSAVDLPITLLLGDADMGNHATAKTLDRPTELAMIARQRLWRGVYAELCGYAIDQAVVAPAGPLRGTVARDEYDRLVVAPAGDVDRTVEVTFPPILEHDVDELVEAIVAADQTGRVPGEIVLRLLLVALGVDDIDEIMDRVTDDEGRLVDSAVTAGQAAVDAFRRGDDPAALLR